MDMLQDQPLDDPMAFLHGSQRVVRLQHVVRLQLENKAILERIQIQVGEGLRRGCSLQRRNWVKKESLCSKLEKL